MKSYLVATTIAAVIKASLIYTEFKERNNIRFGASFGLVVMVIVTSLLVAILICTKFILEKDKSQKVVDAEEIGKDNREFDVDNQDKKATLT